MKESDWKLYSSLVPQWRERYLQIKNEAFAAHLSDPAKTPTDQFWDVLEEMKAEAKVLNSCLGHHSRSRMFLSMAQMLRHDLIFKEDLTEFSEELQVELKRLS